MTKKSQTSGGRFPTLRQAQGMLKQFRAAPALYTKDQVLELEKAIQQDTYRESRCMGMLLLTRSGKDLAESVKKDRGFALAVAHTGLNVRGYVECLEGLLADLKGAEMRALAALACRPDDVDEIVREVQRPKVLDTRKVQQ